MGGGGGGRLENDLFKRYGDFVNIMVCIFCIEISLIYNQLSLKKMGTLHYRSILVFVFCCCCWFLGGGGLVCLKYLT